MEISVRRITIYEQELLKNLYDGIGYPNQKFNPAFFANENNIFLVAYADGVACSFLYAYTLIFPDELYPEVFLYSIDTIEKYRKNGAASKLIIELKSIAKEKGCKEIFVPTNKRNLAAMNLYLKTGGKAEYDDDQIFVYEL